MKSKLVSIGNSKGIRLPKTVIEECALKDEIELLVQGNTVLIRSAHAPRKGWEEAFERMSKKADDQMIDSETPTNWDQTDWKW